MASRAVIYARALTAEEVAERLDRLRLHCQGRYELLADFSDVGPCGFGRMSGWRRMLRHLTTMSEPVVVVVDRIEDFPVSLMELHSLVARCRIETVSGMELDGLARLLQLAQEVDRAHRREKVRFSLRVARMIKRVGRPRKEKRR